MMLTLIPFFDRNMSVSAYSLFTRKNNFLMNPSLLGSRQFDGAAYVDGLELIQELGTTTLSGGKPIFVSLNNISIFSSLESECKNTNHAPILLIDQTFPPVSMYTDRIRELREFGYHFAIRNLPVHCYEDYAPILSQLIPMSGHSKWNNIKRKKEKTDGARAKVFTKIGREISVAVRMGGPNPASNSKLADLIAKAKRMSVPNDNIQRIIKKAEGGDKTEYEAITYEGYGPGGVAVMVETLTDNRNRTAADLRHYFDKNGGNLGAMGCVAFLFNQKGVIDISLEDKDADEAMMDALDAGAEDFDASEDAAEITTDPENYSAVVKALEEKGYEILSDDLAMVPMTTTRLTDPDQLKAMGKLLDALEENDDVQNVWHSLENEENLPE